MLTKDPTNIYSGKMQFADTEKHKYTHTNITSSPFGLYFVFASDVNECVDEDFYNCTDEFHMCVNTRGSYKCECGQDLYFIDGKCRGNKH